MRTLVLAAAVCLLLTGGSAVVGENGTSPSNKVGDGRMGITSSGGSSSASAAVGPNGTEWRSEVSTTNSSCFTNQSSAPADVSYDESGEMEESVSFRASVRAANPCAMLEHEVESTGDSTYVMNITTTPGSELCRMCVGSVSYNASFSTDEPFTLRVLHEGSEVGSLEHPQLGEETDTVEVDEEENRSVLSSIFRWLGSML